MNESDDREMHKATCSDCGAECEVPFKPTEGKPVRCRDCFAKSRPQRSDRGRFNDRRPQQRQMHKATCSDCGNECEVPFKPTEGKPVRCRDCFAKSRD